MIEGEPVTAVKIPACSSPKPQTPTACAALTSSKTPSSALLAQKLRLIRLPASDSKAPIIKLIATKTTSESSPPLKDSTAVAQEDVQVPAKKKLKFDHESQPNRKTNRSRSSIHDSSASPSPPRTQRTSSRKKKEPVGNQIKRSSPRKKVPITEVVELSSSSPSPPLTRKNPIPLMRPDVIPKTEPADSTPSPSPGPSRNLQQKSMFNYFSKTNIKESPKLIISSKDFNENNRAVVDVIPPSRGLFIRFESLGIWYKIYRDNPRFCIRVEPPAEGDDSRAGFT